MQIWVQEDLGENTGINIELQFSSDLFITKLIPGYRGSPSPTGRNSVAKSHFE